MVDPTLTVAVERDFPRGPTIRGAFEVPLGAVGNLVLFGPSGSGKTTVLRCVAGLERPDRGRIALDGEVWFDADRRVSRPPQRRGIGYLPQGFALFPHLDVRGNIGYPIEGLAPKLRAERVDVLIARLGLEGLEHRRPGALSGGQQQRVALARALARQPRLLLLDEPLAALDTPLREVLRTELRNLLREGGVPAIVVTHDRDEALILGDRIGVMVDGALRQVGPAAAVFDGPADADVAAIVGIETILEATVISAGEGRSVLRVGDVSVTAATDLAVGAAIRIGIRADEVSLRGTEPSSGSGTPANLLPGRVTGLEPAGSAVRVRIDCGFALLVRAPNRTVEALGLVVGGSTVAELPADAVRIIG